MRVDYHFHPNFPLFLPWIGEVLARQEAKRIWRAFAKYELDTVVVTEHNYREPVRSFQILKEARPKDAKTEIFPGVEVQTSEGLECIVYAEDESDVFAHEDLLKAWKLSLPEVVALLERTPTLRGIIPHPYMNNSTSIVRQWGEHATIETAKRVGSLEMHNCAQKALERLFEITGFHRLCPVTYREIQKIAQTPRNLLAPGVLATGGSDAHHLWEIGDYMEIDADSQGDRSAMFHIITTQAGTLHMRTDKSILGLFVSLATVCMEYVISSVHRWRNSARLTVNVHSAQPKGTLLLSRNSLRTH